MADPNLELTPEQVQQMLRDDAAAFVLLDCREPHEWTVAHIDGASHIPMGDIPGRIQELDPDAPIVVYCHHGMRSLSVTQFLRERDCGLIPACRATSETSNHERRAVWASLRRPVIRPRPSPDGNPPSPAPPRPHC